MDELSHWRLENRLSEFVSLPSEVTKYMLQQLGPKIDPKLLINICCINKRMHKIATNARLVVDKTFRRVEDIKRWKNENWKISCDLNYSKIEDVSMLGNVHTLNLSRCKGVKDVSMLGRRDLFINSPRNVHTLNLSYCQGVTDVSSLGNVHTLYLVDCQGVTDISALENVHKLDLSWCKRITDISMLGNVHELNLWGCEGVIDVSAIKGKVKELTLPDGEKIEN